MSDSFQENTDSSTEKLVQSLRRINRALLEVSEETVLSLPGVKDLSSDTKGLWLNEEPIINAIRHSLEKFQLDEKQKALRLQDFSKIINPNTSVTVPQKLKEEKELIQKEIDDILKEQAAVETAIQNGLMVIRNHHKEEEEIVYI